MDALHKIHKNIPSSLVFSSVITSQFIFLPSRKEINQKPRDNRLYGCPGTTGNAFWFHGPFVRYEGEQVTQHPSLRPLKRISDNISEKTPVRSRTLKNEQCVHHQIVLSEKKTVYLYSRGTITIITRRARRSRTPKKLISKFVMLLIEFQEAE